jgi:hypothetical protein
MSYVRSVVRPAFQSECCITCGNVTACGCRVVHSCDFCCVSPCYRPGDITSATGILPAERSFAQYVGRCGSPIEDEERIFAPRPATRIAATR